MKLKKKFALSILSTLVLSTSALSENKTCKYGYSANDCGPHGYCIFSLSGPSYCREASPNVNTVTMTNSSLGLPENPPHVEENYHRENADDGITEVNNNTENNYYYGADGHEVEDQAEDYDNDNDDDGYYNQPDPRRYDNHKARQAGAA